MEEQQPRSKFKIWLKRVGWAGFFFFLIKGLIWLFVIFVLKNSCNKKSHASRGSFHSSLVRYSLVTRPEPETWTSTCGLPR